MCEPWPRTIYRGSPPTAPNARTGEFTPPVMKCSARFCSLRDCSVLRTIIPPQQHQPRSGASHAQINITAVRRGRGEGWGACQAKPNSWDFYRVAIFLQSSAAILTSVALLTGRVYQDGLGGLRAVLFSCWKVLRHRHYSAMRSSPAQC